MTIGERIRARRIELGMTQEELARKLGYASRVSINKYELERTLSIKNLDKFAKALECSSAYLIGQAEEDDSEDLINLNKIIKDNKSDCLFVNNLLIFANYLLNQKKG